MYCLLCTKDTQQCPNSFKIWYKIQSFIFVEHKRYLSREAVFQLSTDTRLCTRRPLFLQYVIKMRHIDKLEVVISSSQFKYFYLPETLGYTEKRRGTTKTHFTQRWSYHGNFLVNEFFLWCNFQNNKWFQFGFCFHTLFCFTPVYINVTRPLTFECHIQIKKVNVPSCLYGEILINALCNWVAFELRRLLSHLCWRR